MSAVPPAVFNICKDDDEKHWKEMMEGGDGRGELIPDVRFADDQGMISNSEEELQRLMDRMNEVARWYRDENNCEVKNYDSVSEQREDG